MGEPLIRAMMCWSGFDCVDTRICVPVDEVQPASNASNTTENIQMVVRVGI